MNRISRVAATAFCAGSLALGGVAVGMPDAHAVAPYNSPSTRQALAASATVGDVTATEHTTTLPLLGAPLTIDVTSGPDGTVTSIAVNPASGAADAADTPDTVRFAHAEGTETVEISSHGGGQHVSATSALLADVVGSQTWTGVLCNGTSASIAYIVHADGTVSDATATPTADIHAESSKGLSVAFSNSERVRIRVKHSDQGATVVVSVDDRIRCDVTEPAADPSASTSVPDDQGQDDQGHDDKGHDDKGQHSSDAADDGSNHGAGDDHGTEKTDETDDATAPTTASTSAGPVTSTTVDDHDDAGSGSDASDDSNGDSRHHG